MSKLFDYDVEATEIEEGIPLPAKGVAGRSEKYWRVISGRMTVGSSICICSANKQAKVNLITLARVKLRKVVPDQEFTFRSINDTSFRMWRTR